MVPLIRTTAPTARVPGMDESTTGRSRVPIAPIDAAQPVGSPTRPDREARNRGAARDEDAADAARGRYRELGVEPIEPEERIRTLLAPGEELLAVRRRVVLDRPRSSADGQDADPVAGDLYVTSARLVHVGARVLSFDLDDIEDAELAGERVLMLLRDGVGIALQTEGPRLLRVQVASARAARAGLARRRSDRPQPASR